MNEIELKKLYDKVSTKLDIGDYPTFKSKMQTPEDRKKFFDKTSEKINLGEYSEFEKRLSSTQNETPITPPSPKRTTTTQPSWEKYPCVVNLANKSGSKILWDGSYVIGDFRYYPNGRKGILSTKKVVDYTCNDSEFKSTLTQNNKPKVNYTYTICSDELPIKRFCKNETIKKLQGCLNMPKNLQTGNFGPKTQEYLESLDLPGTRITANSLYVACKGQLGQPNTGGQSGQVNTVGQSGTESQSRQGSQITTNDRTTADYYSDYQTDEVESTSNKTSDSYSNDYSDYSSEEGEEPNTPNTANTPPYLTGQAPPTTNQELKLKSRNNSIFK